jgi:hypothetical protein
VAPGRVSAWPLTTAIDKRRPLALAVEASNHRLIPAVDLGERLIVRVAHDNPRGGKAAGHACIMAPSEIGEKSGASRRAIEGH